MKNNTKFSAELRAIYAGDAPPKLIESRLYAPLKTSDKIVGTQFMGDLFFDDVEHYDQINSVFGVMYKSTNTYIILTKRPENMKRFFENHVYMGAPWSVNYKYNPNFWLGVSVSTQKDADRLIPILLQIPAAVIWISIEPLLEDVYIKPEWRKKISWVVIGAESGPHRRKCDNEWIIRIARTFEGDGIPVFIKQAEINGKVVSMPEILGRVWAEYPN